MKSVLLFLYVLAHTNFCGCGTDLRKADARKLKKLFEVITLGRLPETLTECSGLVTGSNGNLFALNDGGSPAALYELNPDGNLVKEHLLPQLRNHDWEDLTRDTKGHLYIGDFGNNLNKRRNLTIYKLREADLSLVGEIRFSYADQTAFPPAKNNRNFDCEAFVWRNDSLHLFTKDRTLNRHTKHYVLTDAPGTQTAVLSDSLNLAAHITGAALSPDSETLALLGYGKIYLLKPGKNRLFPPAAIGCIPVALSAQAEAIAFLNNGELVIGNEQRSLHLIRKK